ncbi:hypothetical protein [Roseovarius sp.]|uniref:hypothetical protein n=1 Tax=Roseovarius sp. TaxID=1486281 RepID=UPI0035672D85
MTSRGITTLVSGSAQEQTDTSDNKCDLVENMDDRDIAISRAQRLKASGAAQDEMPGAPRPGSKGMDKD